MAYVNTRLKTYDGPKEDGYAREEIRSGNVRGMNTSKQKVNKRWTVWMDMPGNKTIWMKMQLWKMAIWMKMQLLWKMAIVHGS